MTQEEKTGPAAATPPAAVDAEKAAADAARVEQLEAENAGLRAQLVAAGQKAEAFPPAEPSFRFTEDNAHELRTTGRTVSPFGGTRYVGTGPDDARVATAEEFAAAKAPARVAVKHGGSAGAASATARSGRGGRSK